MKKIISLFFTLAMILTPLVAFAADTEVVTLKTDSVRVELLSDTLVRVEAVDASGSFEDRETLIAYGRDDFAGALATVTESETAFTAVTDKYTVTLKKDTALTDDAVEIFDEDGRLLWTYSSGMDKAALLGGPEITSDTVIYYDYPDGVAANDGLTAETAKQGWGGTTGTANAVSGGGTLVFSGRGYIGANYTLPATSSPLMMTGVAPDGTDYRATSTSLNDCTGSFSPKANCTFTLQSDTVFDDIILLSSGASVSKINVKNGAKVVFGEGVTSVAFDSKYPLLALNIEANSTVLYKGGEFSAISGGGTLAVTDTTVANLNDALLNSFTGHIVFTDGETLCTGYTRHNIADGTCTVCGKGASEVPYVPTAGIYAELPAPSATPDVFALGDYPRIIPAENGMAYVGSTDTYSDWERNDATDIYLFLPDGAETLRADFVKLTGKTPISDIKTFGSWYSRYQDWTDEEYLDVIEKYRVNGFPLDVLVVDTRWRAGSDGTGYDISEECFPDMVGYLANAKKYGVLSIFNDHTHQTSNQMLLPEELEHHTTNLQAIMDMGLDGWWYDRNWSYGLKSPYSEITGSTMGKIMYNDIMEAYNGDRRTFLMVNADWDRNGTIESAPSVIGHRYGIQWTGDTTSEALQLREELTNMMYSATVGGSPYISSDLGGFKRSKQQSEEMYTRWMQYGALSPVFRIHSTMSSSKEITKLPYTYSEDTQNVVRGYMNMRYNLLPLFYTLAHENYESGMPLTRRLDFYYPQYEEATDDTQYLLGKDLLVAPIWSAYGEGDDVVPAEWLDDLVATYYNSKDMSGEAVLAESVESINFEWNNDSPATGVNVDNFSVVYEGTITPEEDCYIGVVADDGARIYIDGELFVDGWTSGWLVSHLNTEIKLEAGKTYDIKVEYWEGSTGAACRLVYSHITDEGISARDVFVPDGEWIDVFSGERYVGPKTVRVYHGIETTPVFVRAGAVIPAAKEVSPIVGADFEKLSLNVYAGGNGTYTLCEDDGQSTDYEDGEIRKTNIVHASTEDGGMVTVFAASGSFTTDYTAREWTVRVHSDTPIMSANVDGKAATVIKRAQSDTAMPFSEDGAVPSGDVYEITFVADIDDVTTLTYSVNEEAASVFGDLNGDGEVSLLDVIALLRKIVNQ